MARARAGRRSLQRYAGPPELVVDVAHNPQAARVLARWLAQNPRSAGTLAVFGALSDKDIAGIVAPLAVHIDHWHVAGLDALTPRGLAAAALIERAGLATASTTAHADMHAALDVAACGQTRILAFGSFYVAAEALAWANARGMRSV